MRKRRRWLLPVPVTLSVAIDVLDLFLTERGDDMHLVWTYCFIKVREADRTKNVDARKGYR